MNSFSESSKRPNAIFFLLVLLLATAPGWAQKRHSHRGSAGNAKAAGNTQELFKQYQQKTYSQIDAIEAKYAKLPKKPINFSANMNLAYGSIIHNVPLDVLLQTADALKEAGVQRIDMNLSVESQPEPKVYDKYDALIKHIHAIGLKVAINPEYEQFAHGKATFEEYQKNALKLYPEWAARYKPDVFVLVHEPTTMAARMHVKTTPEQWRGFIEATFKEVKKASPNTRVGAGCFAGGSPRELPFFQEFSKIPELEFLTVDNYVGTDTAINTMEKMTQMAHDAHKPVYMEETWRPHFLPPNLHHVPGASMESESLLGYGDSVFQPIDSKWLHAMALFAATHDMETMTPFQSRLMFTYSDSPPLDGAGFDKKVEAAVLHHERSQTFRDFQQIVKEFGAGK